MKTWVFNEPMLGEAMVRYCEAHAQQRYACQEIEEWIRGFLESDEAKKLRVAQNDEPDCA